MDDQSSLQEVAVPCSMTGSLHYKVAYNKHKYSVILFYERMEILSIASHLILIYVSLDKSNMFNIKSILKRFKKAAKLNI